MNSKTSIFLTFGVENESFTTQVGGDIFEGGNDKGNKTLIFCLIFINLGFLKAELLG